MDVQGYGIRRGKMVPKAGVEPAHPGGRQNLNLVRLPFRHFGTCQRL